MRRVRITGWHPGAEKVSAIMYIRGVAALNLADSKRVIEAVLVGEVAEFTVYRVFESDDIVGRLREFGFDAQDVSDPETRTR
jgi:hypothetical protein